MVVFESISVDLEEGQKILVQLRKYRMSTEKDYIADLTAHLLSISSQEEMETALRNLLTPDEFDGVTKRLQIFKMLEQGIPQRQIADTLGVGIATVTRGSRALKDSQS